MSLKLVDPDEGHPQSETPSANQAVIVGEFTVGADGRLLQTMDTSTARQSEEQLDQSHDIEVNAGNGEGEVVVESEVNRDRGADDMDQEDVENEEGNGGGQVDQEDADKDNESNGEDDNEDVNARKKRGRPRRKIELRLIPQIALRTQTASRSGKNLVKQVKEYMIKTGADAFLQTRYKGPNKTITYTEGKPFKIAKEKDEPKAIFTPDDIQTAVALALAPIVREMQATPSIPIASTSTANIPSFSPRKHPQVAEKPGHCTVCFKKQVVKDCLVFESAWIGCTGGDKDKDPCSKWVHADCLGFPGVTDKDVETMPDYFCADHISFGRRKKKVTTRYESDEETTPTSTQPSIKKGRGRGRGRR